MHITYKGCFFESKETHEHALKIDRDFGLLSTNLDMEI